MDDGSGGAVLQRGRGLETLPRAADGAAAWAGIGNTAVGGGQGRCYVVIVNSIMPYADA